MLRKVKPEQTDWNQDSEESVACADVLDVQYRYDVGYAATRCIREEYRDTVTVYIVDQVQLTASERSI
eukprot:3934604-Rhodomonas_salina.1